MSKQERKRIMKKKSKMKMKFLNLQKHLTMNVELGFILNFLQNTSKERLVGTFFRHGEKLSAKVME